MRFAVALTMALLLAPSLVHANEAEPRDALAVSIFSVDGVGAIIAWTPAPNAVGYSIFRGSTPDSAVYIGQSAFPVYHDATLHSGDTWYVILSIAPQNGGPVEALELGVFRGSCVNHRGTTGVSVTAAHCIPADPF